jgi:HAD superfamily hydrolase (TIGR01509 family)
MRAFIFDFDGVIVDSENYWDAFTYDAYKEFIPSFTREYDRKLKGRNVNDIYEMIVRDFGPTLTKAEYMTHVAKLTDKIYNELTQLLPGVHELVALLRSKNIPMGIASSSQTDWIEATLKRLKMESVFTPIVTAQDVGIGKPDPAVYLEAAKQMGFDPTDCCAIEDSLNGLRAAKAANMTCIGLHHPTGGGHAQDLSAADIEVNSLTEIDDAMIDSLVSR